MDAFKWTREPVGYSTTTTSRLAIDHAEVFFVVSDPYPDEIGTVFDSQRPM